MTAHASDLFPDKEVFGASKQALFAGSGEGSAVFVTRLMEIEKQAVLVVCIWLHELGDLLLDRYDGRYRLVEVGVCCRREFRWWLTST